MSHEIRPTSTPAAVHRPRRGVRASGRLLPLLGLLPAIALAVRSLTLPWAHARVFLVWGVSRSATAQVLVLLAIAATIASTVAIAGHKRLWFVGVVHLGTGAILCAVAWLAFSMVRHAGVRALGVLPVASVHPGPGLRHFGLAALLVVLLGVIEVVLALTWRRRRGAAPAPRS